MSTSATNHYAVRVGDKHLVRSTYTENVRFAIALGEQAGHTLLDGTGRSASNVPWQSREALKDGFDDEALFRAKTAPGGDHPTLF